MASILLQNFRHMRATVLLQEPMKQKFLKCSPSEIYYDVCRHTNAAKLLSRAKSTSLPGRVKKRLIILENKTFSETKVVEEAEKKVKASEDETKPQLTNTVPNMTVDEKSQSNLVYLQKNKCESEKPVKSTKLDQKTSSKSQQSSKVAGLSYVRKCCIYNPIDQIKVTSDLSGDYAKYKKFVDNLSLSSIPSVTAIINATMPDSARYFLNRWKKQMIEELGQEGFKEHQKKTLGLGKNLHSCIQKYLEGMSQDDLPIEADNNGHWRSLAHVLPDISDVRAIEVDVSHQTLLYHGKFDCIAKYRDMLCVIDWKTSKKSKPSLSNTFDNPIQLAAYLGAVNSSRLDVGGEDTKVRQCALVIAYPHGDPAHVHIMDSDEINTYWDKWLDRLEYYWVLKSNNKLPAWI